VERDVVIEWLKMLRAASLSRGSCQASQDSWLEDKLCGDGLLAVDRASLTVDRGRDKKCGDQQRRHHNSSIEVSLASLQTHLPHQPLG
jgi:hypothetical protein